MTSILKPKRFNLHIIYQCPECGSELWATPQEAANDGQGITCCNKLWKIQSLHNLRLRCKTDLREPDLRSAKTDIREPNLRSAIREPSRQSIPDEVIDCLEELGFERSEIKSSLKTIDTNCETDELIERFLQQYAT